MALAARIVAAGINVVGALIACMLLTLVVIELQIAFGIDPIALLVDRFAATAAAASPSLPSWVHRCGRLGTLMANGTHRARGQFVAVQMFRLFTSSRRDKRGTFRILMSEFKRGKRPSLPAKGRGYGDKRKDDYSGPRPYGL